MNEVLSPQDLEIIETRAGGSSIPVVAKQTGAYRA
jgi:hypothetical protein